MKNETVGVFLIILLVNQNNNNRFSLNISSLLKILCYSYCMDFWRLCDSRLWSVIKLCQVGVMKIKRWPKKHLQNKTTIYFLIIVRSICSYYEEELQKPYAFEILKIFIIMSEPCLRYHHIVPKQDIWIIKNSLILLYVDISIKIDHWSPLIYWKRTQGVIISGQLCVIACALNRKFRQG